MLPLVRKIKCARKLKPFHEFILSKMAININY